MADVHSKEVRSYNLSRIRSKDTKPEMLVRKFLFSKGYRYRLHDKKLSGKPDIVLPKYKTVIFVHGCFWHGHENCKYATIPKTKSDWWNDKIQKNIRNDKLAGQSLETAGWNVITIWGCRLKKQFLQITLNSIPGLITGS